MQYEPCFFRTGQSYQATQACRGPWDPKSLNGAMIVALLAFEIEQQHLTDDYMPARLTVDMYRLPDFSPIEVKTRLVRDGYRIKVVDAEFFSNDISMARATCQLLRKTENSPQNVWSPPDWAVPNPDEIPPPSGERHSEMGSRRMRPISGSMSTFGKKQLWISEQRNLVDEIPLSPWMQVALMADFANPFANSGDGGLGYINSDVTLYLHRLPVDEWLGLEVTNHRATDGVAIAECYIYDLQGMIGSSSVTGLAQKRGPRIKG
jgi:acyl-CoA thioesterase